MITHEEKIREMGANLINSNKLNFDVDDKFIEQLRDFFNKTSKTAK